MKKNKSIHHLVVGIDFSDYSNVVVNEAKALAKELNISIIYVHSYTDERWPEHMRAELLNSLPEQIRATYNLEVDSDVRTGFGDAAKFLLQVANKVTQPLILVGHKGKNPLVRLFLGSTAEKLAQISPYPVWIHRGDRIILPHKILVPSDLGRQTNRTLRKIKSLSENLQPDIELYHVAQKPIPLLNHSTWNYVYADMMANDDKQFTQFKKNHIGYKIVREQGIDVANMIEKKAQNFDVVAVSPKGKGDSIPFMGHITSRVIRSIDKPVLIFH